MESGKLAGRIQSVRPPYDCCLMTLAGLIRSALRIGPMRATGLAFRKAAKQARYWRMMQELPKASATAEWNGILPASRNWPKADSERILAMADAMLRDENTFFTFPYRLRGIDRVWEFDPLEKKYWPRRHYSERHLHAPDTPRDAKIVWEINRFADLPVLGQAYALTHDDRYAEEALWRMRSWIDGNPFASTVNWASALEISIRLISWSTTILLLGGRFDETIALSVYQQARYLAADLSTDKLVPSNHLIGEAAGVFLVSSLWNFPQSEHYARLAKQILSREIVRQTFEDGVTREASSWYHRFVTDLCDLADRVGAVTGNPFGEQFRKRLANMKAFLQAMTVNGTLVRYGDADDGWALSLRGSVNEWMEAIFGAPPTAPSKLAEGLYPSAELIAAQVKNAFLLLRAGAFGMGGAGSSSHAHDDLLSPILHLAGQPVLADPGTYVYNGKPKDRNRFRTAEAHNGIIVGVGTGAVPKLNFGWSRIRPDAKILEAAFTDREAIVKAQYGEWPGHRRIIKLKQDQALILDRFEQPMEPTCTWRLHLDPQWKLHSKQPNNCLFRNESGKILSIKLRGASDDIRTLPYDFSPSYGVLVPATMIEFSALKPTGVFAVLLTIESAL